MKSVGMDELAKYSFTQAQVTTGILVSIHQ